MQKKKKKFYKSNYFPTAKIISKHPGLSAKKSVNQFISLHRIFWIINRSVEKKLQLTPGCKYIVQLLLYSIIVN